MRRASRKRSVGKAAKSARPARVRHLALQPDALGVATRLAAARLREGGIDLKPLLRSAGLSASQISLKDLRVGVASQIRFLELAAEALNDPVLGFRLARDGELRLVGLLHYVVASSQTLGDAADRAQRYSQGLTFGEILEQLRSDLATHYLGDADLPISEIAWLVGYQGVSAFSHGYKRRTGMSPKNMRAKLLASH